VNSQKKLKEFGKKFNPKFLSSKKPRKGNYNKTLSSNQEIKSLLLFGMVHKKKELFYNKRFGLNMDTLELIR